MGQIWITSDSHFGHAFMAVNRGFDSVEAHDRAIVRNYRKVVQDRDDVFFLGDVALGTRANGLALIAALPGRKHLVLGNHDRAHPMNGNSHIHQAEYLRAFTSVQTSAMLRRDGLQVLLSHFPYSDPLHISPVTPGPVWRESEFPGYFANSGGQVRGRFGRVLKPWTAGEGYEYVSISQGGAGVRHATVHRVVCGAFHGPKPEGMEVAHNDGNLLNNSAYNLRWTTRPDNQMDRQRHGTSRGRRYSRPGEQNPNAKLSAQDVAFIRESSEPATKLAPEFDVKPEAIRRIRRSESWSDRSEIAPSGEGETRSEHDDRATQWRLRDEGLPLVHGHVHDAVRVRTSERGTMMMHAGLDAWGLRPATLPELLAEAGLR